MSKHSTDANQAAIVAELKQRGFSVDDLSRAGRSFPDLLVSYAMQTIAVEIKMPEGRFRIGQLEWMANHKGLCGFATSAMTVVEMFETPTTHCLMPRQKQRILEFVERWKLDGKGNEISVKKINELLGR